MTRQECRKLKPGDRIFVLREEAYEHGNVIEAMYDYIDYEYLTVREVYYDGDGVRIKEDNGGWYWNREVIERYESPDESVIETAPDLSTLFKL